MSNIQPRHIEGNVDAYMDYTTTYCGQPMDKSEFFPYQASLLPVHPPRLVEGLVGLRTNQESWFESRRQPTTPPTALPCSNTTVNSTKSLISIQQTITGTGKLEYSRRGEEPRHCFWECYKIWVDFVIQKEGQMELLAQRNRSFSIPCLKILRYVFHQFLFEHSKAP